MPKEKLRDWWLEQVRIKSPNPDRPTKVSGRAPKALPKRNSSAKPRVTKAAVALGPSARPTTMPAAMAKTFLAAPPISTPRMSLEWYGRKVVDPSEPASEAASFSSLAARVTAVGRPRATSSAKLGPERMVGDAKAAHSPI